MKTESSFVDKLTKRGVLSEPQTPVIISDYQPFSNDFGAIRLKKVRNSFGDLPTKLDIPIITDLFVNWYKFEEIMPIRCTYRNLKTNTNETDLSIHKSIKRCNPEYIKAIRSKLQPFLDNEPKIFFDRDWGVKKTNALSIVLEYNANEHELGNAWFNVGIDFNRFLSYLKKHFGKFVHIRTWQSHDTGYPHIHVIIYFNNFEFSVVEWNNTFRIHPKQKVKSKGNTCRNIIKDAWKHGFVDIKCIDSMGGTFKDLLKYVTRDLDGGAYTLTNSMVWYFRKQSFGISKEFRKVVWDLDDSIGLVEPTDADGITQLRSNSNRKLIAIEVFPIFPAYYFHEPCVTLFNYDKPPPFLSPNIENFLDNFVSNKCDVSVRDRGDGVIVTTYKIRGESIL